MLYGLAWILLILFGVVKSCGCYLVPFWASIKIRFQAELILEDGKKTLQTADWSERIVTRIVIQSRLIVCALFVGNAYVFCPAVSSENQTENQEHHHFDTLYYSCVSLPC